MWITARMVHVYGLGVLLDVPGSAAIAQQVMAGLTGPLRDRRDGGWYTSVTDGVPMPGKSCYDHAFVLLAASTAVHARLPGADELLEDACSVFHDRFWDDDVGMCVDSWDSAFESLHPYRGLNANMHAVEAMLTVAATTGDQVWIERAERICRFVIGQARANGWRIPEHYDARWRPELDVNRDRPADQFKPFGATVGHALEWARLLVHLAHAPGVADGNDDITAAEALFARAVSDGWCRNGVDGFLYTTDWAGVPVVSTRLHWVLTEAINAASVLHAATQRPTYAENYHTWWDHAAQVFIDDANGSWRHELDERNRPAATVWSGKPDLYHAFQATLVPLLPLYPMVAPALASTAGRR